MRGQQSVIHCREGRKSRAVTAEPQPETSAGADQSGGQIDQLLDHGFEPAAFGRMPDRGMLAQQPQLTDHPEDVIGKTTQGHHQSVGGELATGQSFQIGRASGRERV
mgnify:CR=1 FL=1